MNSFGAKSTLNTPAGPLAFFRLDVLEKAGLARMSRLPYCLRVLLESLLRLEDGRLINADDVRALAAWRSAGLAEKEIPFIPARVLLQDFTGVPVVADLAALRDAAKHLGADPKLINPVCPVDLVIDHSVQTDYFGSPDAFNKNVALEYERNRERYAFLKWGQKSLRNFRAVPPGTGIVHQVNLEYLAGVALTRQNVVFPDTVVGTDSHTTMINGLGVLGWGVGGIEAEAAMLGQPLSMLIPEVVGVKLTGTLPEGATATDAVLHVTQLLRRKNVVGKFVEYFGPGLSALSLPDRATLANMGPEYGATCGYFPVDDETLAYLRLTGRDEKHVGLVESYFKEQGLFRTAQSPDPQYTDVVGLDLSRVEPSLAGPKRPQDRVPLKEAKSSFQSALLAPVKERGFELSPEEAGKKAAVFMDGRTETIGQGTVVIASITSCTNTSNPSVMIAAGLLAKKAVERGLSVKPFVKTSLAPGSRVVTDYLNAAGLTPFLEKLRFHLVGYGCLTCIGNSGPLPEEVGQAVRDGNLVVASVLSGNRNFEGRINPLVKANYLASPPLVVAYALAGRMDLDLTTEPIGVGADGKPVFLRDLWPTAKEIMDTANGALKKDLFLERYADLGGDDHWKKLSSPQSDLFAWEENSTYIKRPPFVDDISFTPPPVHEIENARVLAVLGDSVTTDHISPAGNIALGSPAAQHLQALGVGPKDFNSYGSRRGNHDVMVRGTFANIRLKNGLVPGTEGGVTLHLPDETKLSIFDAAVKYQAEKTPLLVLAGKEYGSGSSRDWAAKGVFLLGVKAVIAESFERIHRSNLAGMGVLPLQFIAGESREVLGLTGKETYDIAGIAVGLAPKKTLTVRARRADKTAVVFSVIARLDTPVEVDYYLQGGILPAVLRQLCLP